MGAQVAALLSGPPPYGSVPALQPTRRLSLPLPACFSLRATACSAGAVALPGSSWDGTSLTRRLPGAHVRVDATLQVALEGTEDGALPALTRVLGLTDDLDDLHAGCAQVPSLAWVPAAGAGRVLRGATVFEDLVVLLASTRTSFAATRAVLARLIGTGAFPDAETLARLGEPGLRAAGLGYRAPALHALARAAADGTLDAQGWTALSDDEVRAAVLALPGFGPFSAASLLPLLGRPRPLVLDGWLRDRARALGLHDDADVRARYAPLGPWAGTGLWLEAATWLRPA